MTPREMFFLRIWPAFKRMAIRALGRTETAEFLEEAARLLRAEQNLLVHRHEAAEESTVIFLGDRD